MKMNAARLEVLVFTLLLGGCATSNNPQDPLEGYNRAMFGFNDKADKFVMKPVATAYHTVLPSFVQTGIGNFFGNLADVWTGVNNLLEGKGGNGMTDFARVGINSTFGVAGLFDIGSAIGLQKHNRDFGETLGTWGVGPGPYVVLPLLGSSTLRDSVALPVDFAGNPWSYKYPARVRNEGIALNFVDQRSRLLDASNLLDEAALDRYEFVRDGYLQRRESKVHEEDQSNAKPGDSAPAQPDKSDKSDKDVKTPTEPGAPSQTPAPAQEPGTAPK
jgi:phospholipid-binding lipoprotein MlaA